MVTADSDFDDEALDVRHSFGIAYAEVLRDPMLSASAKGLYAYLTTYAGATGAWPAMRTMTRELAASPSSIRRWRAELIDHEYVTVKARTYASGASSTSTHRLWSPERGGTAGETPGGTAGGRGGVPLVGGGGTAGETPGGTAGETPEQIPYEQTRARGRAGWPGSAGYPTETRRATWTPERICHTCHYPHDPADPDVHPPSQRARGSARAESIAAARAGIHAAREKVNSSAAKDRST